MLPFVLHDLNLEHLSKIGEETAVRGEDFYHASSTDHFNYSSTVSGPFFNKHIALRATVGVACCLSMFGAALIILSYFLIRDIQTKSRQILVHLSFADFGVASSNFIGVVVYFDQYIRHCPTSSEVSDNHVLSNGGNTALSCHSLKGMCKAQAFFAGFSTLASVLWTLCLAVYIYCLVVHSSKRVHYKVLYVACILCWGLPLFISLWLICTGRLGYSPHGGSGWCTLKIDDSSGRQDTFTVIFGNDLWIYLTFILVTLLYFTTHCYIKFQTQIQTVFRKTYFLVSTLILYGLPLLMCAWGVYELRESNPYILQGNNLITVSKADTKFILIPFFFLLLRVWTMILVILLVYAHVSPPHLLSCILLYAAGIGDSGQGFVNALLFCVFTPKVRKQFIFFLANTRCLRKLLRMLAPRPTDSTPHSLSSTFPVMRSRSKKCTSPLYDASSPTSSQESESRSIQSDTVQQAYDGSQQQAHNPDVSQLETQDASQLEDRSDALLGLTASDVLQLRHARPDASQLVSMHQSDASIQSASCLGDRRTRTL